MTIHHFRSKFAFFTRIKRLLTMLSSLYIRNFFFHRVSFCYWQVFTRWLTQLNDSENSERSTSVRFRYRNNVMTTPRRSIGMRNLVNDYLLPEPQMVCLCLHDSWATHLKPARDRNRNSSLIFVKILRTTGVSMTKTAKLFVPTSRLSGATESFCSL